jgi:2-keto-3-deoxy-L-rhamnonate aldolase RhmA
MSADMGISAQWDHEDLLAAGESVIRAARSRGLVSASTCPTLDMAARWKHAGVNMLVATGDVGLLRTGLIARLAEVKAL